MAKLRLLKPEVDRINELYEEDREKKGAALMELYRKEGVNPVGGCLPQLLQMPVWIAFYASLSSNAELYKAGFILHWTDLSSPDPLFTLPIALGALMFVQQKIAPTTGTMDPAQAKIMLYMMPIMLTSVFFFLPSGLCLYAVTNSVLTLIQQQIIYRSLEHEGAANKSTTQLATQAVAAPPVPSSSSQAEEKPRQRKARKRPTKRRTRRG